MAVIIRFLFQTLDQDILRQFIPIDQLVYDPGELESLIIDNNHVQLIHSNNKLNVLNYQESLSLIGLYSSYYMILDESLDK